MAQKGLLCSIYRTKSYRGVGNVFEHVDDVTLVGEGIDGKPVNGVFEPSDKAPAVKLVIREIRGVGTYVHAEPVDRPEGAGNPMFGGTMIHTSDGRFGDATGVPYPIKLHDRFESRR